MRRIASYTLGLAILVLGALVLTACGSSSGSSKSSSASSSSSDTVSLKSISGVGTVLVDSKGFALYSPVQEKSGKIHCTGGCTAIWIPLALPKGAAGAKASGSLMSKLGTVTRPDGVSQVTFDGKPLYRFKEDGSAGKVTGNGVSDSFGGKSFTWHVASSGAVKTQPSGGGGYGGGGGGYSTGY